jgi:hypothetical protein
MSEYRSGPVPLPEARGDRLSMRIGEFRALTQPIEGSGTVSFQDDQSRLGGR